jgi:malonyl-CoA O-methyltransferase
MYLKNMVQTSFSRFCSKYEKEAVLQREAGKHLIEFAKPNLKGKILDLGCGTGFLGEFIDKNLIGLDISKSMLEIANSKGYTPIQGDIENLPFKSNTFDTILSNFSLHWLDLDKAFSEVNRVLKKESYFIFNIPIKNTLSIIEKITGKVYFNFLSDNDILKITDNYFRLVDFRYLELKLEFKNGFELLKHLHNTGVNINPKGVSFREKKKIIEQFKNYDKKALLNYNLLFVKCFKK